MSYYPRYRTDYDRREYYRWEVNEFHEVSQKLRELASMIPHDVASYEEVDIALAETLTPIINNQNHKIRALAREIRELRKLIEKGVK